MPTPVRHSKLLRLLTTPRLGTEWAFSRRLCALGVIPCMGESVYWTNHAVKPSVTPKEKAATRASDDGLALCGGKAWGTQQSAS
jgi:hypothetical protein